MTTQAQALNELLNVIWGNVSPAVDRHFTGSFTVLEGASEALARLFGATKLENVPEGSIASALEGFQIDAPEARVWLFRDGSWAIIGNSMICTGGQQEYEHFNVDVDSANMVVVEEPKLTQ